MLFLPASAGRKGEARLDGGTPAPDGLNVSVPAGDLREADPFAVWLHECVSHSCSALKAVVTAAIFGTQQWEKFQPSLVPQDLRLGEVTR